MEYVLIAIGGGCGAVARFLMDSCYKATPRAKFGVGIAIVNILACFLIGVAGAHLSAVTLSYKAIVGGFLGGFSTYSTHIYDAYELWQQKNHYASIKLLLGTYLLSLIAVWAGYTIF